ncbi:MAG: class 1 fructose-bisphosphatase [Leptospirillia bacterium]
MDDRLGLKDLVRKAAGLSEGERNAATRILEAIAQGGREMASLLSDGPLRGLTGASGAVNVQGEEVQTFDEIAQEVFTRNLRDSASVNLLVSEEREEPEALGGGAGALHVAMDPLDGSSNLAVSGPVGSIFCAYRPASRKTGSPAEEVLAAVGSPVMAAYVLYSVSTLLVVSFGQEVRQYALENSRGEFLPLPGAVRFPEKGGNIISLNAGNSSRWREGDKHYLRSLEGKSYSARYVGALVMDFHRNLLKGGIYLYPGDLPKADKAGSLAHPEGKLRLLYEAIPMAWIARAAGGEAVDGHRPILEVPPVHIHQRVPLVVGTASLVADYLRLVSSVS